MKYLKDKCRRSRVSAVLPWIRDMEKMLPRDKPVNVIAIVDNLELRVPNRLPKDATAEETHEEAAVVAATEETTNEDKVRARGTRSCRRKYVTTSTRLHPTKPSPRIVRLSTRQQQTRRRNPVRSVTRKESERRRQQQQQQQRGGGTRAPSREKPTSEPEEVGAEYEAPTLQDEMQWRSWPAHGMHERPVYHPQFGLAAEYNGRLFASFDGQRYREVVDLEVVRVDPRPTVVETKRAPEATFTVQQQRALEQLRSLQRLRLQPCSPLPMCDVQPFKHNANGKLFFVKAPVQNVQRVAAPSTCTTSRTTRPALDLASTQVLDLSNKPRRSTQQTEPPPPPPRKVEQRQQNPGCSFNPQHWSVSANSLNLVRYFQNFGADGSIDDTPQSQVATAQPNTSNPIDAHPSQR